MSGLYNFNNDDVDRDDSDGFIVQSTVSSATTDAPVIPQNSNDIDYLLPSPTSSVNIGSTNVNNNSIISNSPPSAFASLSVTQRTLQQQQNNQQNTPPPVYTPSSPAPSHTAVSPAPVSSVPTTALSAPATPVTASISPAAGASASLPLFQQYRQQQEQQQSQLNQLKQQQSLSTQITDLVKLVESKFEAVLDIVNKSNEKIANLEEKLKIVDQKCDQLLAQPVQQPAVQSPAQAFPPHPQSQPQQPAQPSQPQLQLPVPQQQQQSVQQNNPQMQHTPFGMIIPPSFPPNFPVHDGAAPTSQVIHPFQPPNTPLYPVKSLQYQPMRYDPTQQPANPSPQTPQGQGQPQQQANLTQSQIQAQQNAQFMKDAPPSFQPKFAHPHPPYGGGFVFMHQQPNASHLPPVVQPPQPQQPSPQPSYHAASKPRPQQPSQPQPQSDQLHECPFCSKKFQTNEIENHVNQAHINS